MPTGLSEKRQLGFLFVCLFSLPLSLRRIVSKWNITKVASQRPHDKKNIWYLLQRLWSNLSQKRRTSSTKTSLCSYPYSTNAKSRVLGPALRLSERRATASLIPFHYWSSRSFPPGYWRRSEAFDTVIIGTYCLCYIARTWGQKQNVCCVIRTEGSFPGDEMKIVDTSVSAR